jgi:putative membrane protein
LSGDDVENFAPTHYRNARQPEIDRRRYEMMFWYGDGVNAWGAALMIVSMVLFWSLLIFGVVNLVRYSTAEVRPAAPPLTTEQMLAERFARGEIDEPEYRGRLEVLRGESRTVASS